MAIADYYATRTAYKIGGARLRHILAILPAQKLDVLDVGCGAGDLARALTKIGHTVDGLDISNEALREASDVLRNKYLTDLSLSGLPRELITQRYDLIVFSEVLEHTFSPDEVLSRFVPLLSEGGAILVTVPNFLFWKIRLSVLLGNFQYDKRGGLLDFGHIRFFTRRYAEEVFTASRLCVIKENHFYPNLYSRGLSWLGNIFPSLFAYQLIYFLQKNKVDTHCP